MIRKLQITCLVLIPLVFLVIGLRFDRTKFGTDPESAYLMNGLNIAMGKAVGHFDNPGTTVQVYSSVVLRITHFFRFSDNDLQTDVLLNSEYYIEVLRIGLILINSCVILILGFVAFTLLGNLWAGLLLQVTPFLSVTLMEECFTKIAPEQFLFMTVAVLIIVLLKFYTSLNPGNKNYALLFGLLAGFGLATKLTFLPLLIIPFVVLAGKRNKWIYVGSIIPSFIIFTMPAAKGYMSMAKWFLNLGTHTGTYGQGDAGFIDPVKYFNALVSIAVNNKALLAVMVLATVVLVIVRFGFGKLNHKDYRNEFYLLLALLLAQIGSILMVAKHYQSNHYLFPALSLTGFVLVVIILLINKQLKSKNKVFIRYSFPVLVAAGIGFSLLNIPYMTLAYNGYRASNQSTDEAIATLNRDYKDYVKVYYYPATFNVYSSLRWGNTYSRLYSTEKLMNLYPDGLFYNALEKRFQLWETSISTREFLAKYGRHILLVGGPLVEEEFRIVEKSGLKLKRLFDSRVQVVYEIDIDNSEIFSKEVHHNAPVWSLQNDFETFSADGQWIISPDGAKFCKKSSLETGKARSGKFAFSLPGPESYGMEYEIADVKPGDAFEISVWKTADSPEAYLAASQSVSSDSPFYEQSRGYVETDSKGWEKVTLDFKIPAGYKGDKLKVYLWNHGKTHVWFDDFQVDKY